jgi:hypothetical protein
MTRYSWVPKLLEWDANRRKNHSASYKVANDNCPRNITANTDSARSREDRDIQADNGKFGEIYSESVDLCDDNEVLGPCGEHFFVNLHHMDLM